MKVVLCLVIGLKNDTLTLRVFVVHSIGNGGILTSFGILMDTQMLSDTPNLTAQQGRLASGESRSYFVSCRLKDDANAKEENSTTHVR